MINPTIKEKQRKEFEKAYLERHPDTVFTLTEKGLYFDTDIYLAWAAYWNAFTIFYHQFHSKRKLMVKNKQLLPGSPFVSEVKSGPFFIGGYANNSGAKTFSFSKTPRFHSKLENAETEAQRLANQRGGKYIIFGRASLDFLPQEGRATKAAMAVHADSDLSERMAERKRILEKYTPEDLAEAFSEADGSLISQQEEPKEKNDLNKAFDTALEECAKDIPSAYYPYSAHHVKAV